MKLFIMLFLINTACFSSQHDLDCRKIGETLGEPIYKCINEDVVCYQYRKEFYCVNIEEDEPDCSCIQPPRECIEFCERD